MDATHVREIGERDSADVTILRVAVEQSAIVVTQDNDFPQLPALSKASGPSIVLLREGSPNEPEEIVALFASFSEDIIRDLADGAVVSIDQRGERIRRLPLR